MEFNYAEIVMLLLATIGPLKVTIVAATITAGASPPQRRAIARRSVLIAMAVCVLFTFLGEAILRLFKVSVPAFQIGGGIIVLLFSIEMVMGGKPAGKDAGVDDMAPPGEPSLDIAVYPLAIPLMASVSGLVAIVSVIAQRDDLATVLSLAGLIAAIMGLNYACLLACQAIVRAVGPVTLQVVGKIMGVILAALAVELIIVGLTGAGLVTRAV